ncbi:MAG: DNA primase [Deferribacteres bacterium]|nr:DNA primase [Deferribacteres bacterium]
MGIETLLDEVKSRLDIVEVISTYLPLKKRGKNYVALCPFHVEKTPSFTVSPEKQMFYCFGCGKGGDVVKFLMLMEDLSFREALAKAAEMAGVEVSFEDFREKEDTNRLREIHKILCEWFCRFLKTDAGKRAREYLISRGITPPWWERFRIGFAPSGFDLASPLMKKGFKREELIESGLFSERNGTLSCKFVNRITIPIWDGAGRVIAFGGRILGKGEPKYLNSPETPIFNKGRVVYAYHLAKEGIKQKGRAIVVEGYMDVISLHIKGYTEAVAALGTAFTSEQAKKILRLTKNVYLLFDGDDAGIRAALRASKVFYGMGVEPRVALLPEGEDPDSFVRSGRDLDALLSEALTPVDLVIKLKSAEAEGALARSRLVDEVLELVEGVEDSVVLESFFSYVSSKLGLSPDSIASRFDRKRFSAKRKEDGNSKPKAAEVAWERSFLKMVVRNRQLMENLWDKLQPEVFQDEFVSSVIGKIKEAGGVEAALDALDEEEMKFVGNALFCEEDLPEGDLISRFERRFLEFEVERLKRAFLSEPDKELSMKLQQEYLEKLKLLKGGM